MEVDITPLREIAPVFAELGETIVKNEALDVNITFGHELLATAEYFRRVTDTLDLDDYTPDELQELLDNLYKCQCVTLAGANPNWSPDEQLQAVDRAAERLDFGIQCFCASEKLEGVIDRLHGG